MVLKDEVIYALTCMKVYYGESTHQLFFPATKNQIGHGLTARTNFNRLEELPDFKGG